MMMISIIVSYLDKIYKISLASRIVTDAFIGEDFNYSAILDDYTIVRELGQGGFGKVMLGRHKEDRKEVAIKFMDVSENRNSSYLCLTHL